jgi:recombination DNA repair RAD52 pathway protein
MSHTIEDVYKYVKAIHKCTCATAAPNPFNVFNNTRGRSESKKVRANTNKTRALSVKRANNKEILKAANIKPSGANLAVFRKLLNSGVPMNEAINKTRAAKNMMKSKRANTLAKKTTRKSKSPSL